MRVVMQCHQLGKQGGQIACAGPFLPAADHFLALQLFEIAQLGGQVLGVVAEVSVVAQQVGQTRLFARLHLHHLRCPHASDQRQGQRNAADLGAFAFDEHRAAQIELAHLLGQQSLEVLLARLLHTRQIAQERAFVAGVAFEIEHLCALRGECAQDARFGAARGAAEHAQLQLRHEGFDLLHHMAAVAFVATGELLRVPAHQAQPGHHRAAAQAAAPAVDQRFPVGRLVVEGVTQMARQVGAHHGSAQALGLERADLLVDGADLRPLFIVEHRAVDGAGDAVEGKFGRRTRVDDGLELVDFADANGLAVGHGKAWR